MNKIYLYHVYKVSKNEFHNYDFDLYGICENKEEAEDLKNECENEHNSKGKNFEYEIIRHII